MDDKEKQALIANSLWPRPVPVIVDCRHITDAERAAIDDWLADYKARHDKKGGC